jgi:hypothetical protein
MFDGGCSGIGNGVQFHPPFGSRKALTPVCLFWPGSHLVLSGPLEICTVAAVSRRLVSIAECATVRKNNLVIRAIDDITHSLFQSSVSLSRSAQRQKWV